MADDAIVGIGDEALPPRVPALWLDRGMDRAPALMAISLPSQAEIII